MASCSVAGFLKSFYKKRMKEHGKEYSPRQCNLRAEMARSQNSLGHRVKLYDEGREHSLLILSPRAGLTEPWGDGNSHCDVPSQPKLSRTLALPTRSADYRCGSPCFLQMLNREPFFNSTQIAESQGSSFRLRVGVPSLNSLITTVQRNKL